MQRLRDLIAHWIMGLIGIVSGVLSVIGFAVAAVVPAVLGVLTVALSPLRAITDRIRGE